MCALVTGVDVCSSELLVLHHLDAGRVADDVFTDFDSAGAADIETHRCIEFERVAAGRGFGVAVHHADLHAQLVDEDNERFRFVDRAVKLAERLRPQSGLKADMAVAHFTLNFSEEHTSEFQALMRTSYAVFC